MEQSEVRTVKKGDAEIFKTPLQDNLVCRKYFEIYACKINFKARFLTSIHIFWAILGPLNK